MARDKQARREAERRYPGNSGATDAVPTGDDIECYWCQHLKSNHVEGHGCTTRVEDGSECECGVFQLAGRSSSLETAPPEAFRDSREGGKGTITQRLHWLEGSAIQRDSVVPELSKKENAKRQAFYEKQFVERRDALIADVEALLKADA